MRKLLLSLPLLLSLTASAKDVAGVSVPDTTTVAGTTLKLNGAGLRTKVVFKVYVGALYLAAPSKDGNAILASDTPRQFVQVFLRDIDKAKIDETWREGFEQRGGMKVPAVKERLEKLLAVTTAVKEKDKAVFTYVPGKGVTVNMNGEDKLTLDGKEFADMMFSGWVGDQPVDKDLREALLGK
jgi:hypothetical protein